MKEEKTAYLQDYMGDNICFGCGSHNHEGLRIKSFWEGEDAVCIWKAEEKHQGWKGLLNGGIMATIIDCHCMATATTYAYRLEERPFDSMPLYRYATGTLTVKYVKPTPADKPIKLVAKVKEVKGRKTVMDCEAWVDGVKTAESEVIAIRVFDSSQEDNSAFTT